MGAVTLAAERCLEDMGLCSGLGGEHRLQGAPTGKEVEPEPRSVKFPRGPREPSWEIEAPGGPSKSLSLGLGPIWGSENALLEALRYSKFPLLAYMVHRSLLAGRGPPHALAVQCWPPLPCSPLSLRWRSLPALRAMA